jgi:hypothetical protein
MSYRQALEVIKKNGGIVDGEKVTIKVQKPRPVRLEVGFEGHHPIEKKELNIELIDKASFEFEGIGFAVSGTAEGNTKGSSKTDYTFEVEMYIDRVLALTTKLPTNYIKRKFIPFWKYQLPIGKHTVHFKVLNPTDKARIHLSNAIIYSDRS